MADSPVIINLGNCNERLVPIADTRRRPTTSADSPDFVSIDTLDGSGVTPRVCKTRIPPEARPSKRISRPPRPSCGFSAVAYSPETTLMRTTTFQIAVELIIRFSFRIPNYRQFSQALGSPAVSPLGICPGSPHCSFHAWFSRQIACSALFWMQSNRQTLQSTFWREPLSQSGS